MLLRHQLLKLMLCGVVLCFEWMSFEASSNPTPHETNGNRAERLHAWSQPHDYPRLVSDWNKDWSMDSGPGAPSLGGSQAKCIAIPVNMTLCHGAGYSEMRLPNLLDHESLETASRQAESWVPLLNIRCHPDTQVFLCSLFAPVCLDHPIWPCRSLCQVIQTGCEPLMLRYGFPWPEMLSCEKFPIDNDLCVGIQNHLRPLPPQGKEETDRRSTHSQHIGLGVDRILLDTVDSYPPPVYHTTDCRACFKENLSLHIFIENVSMTFLTFKNFYLSIKISDDFF